MQNLLTLHLSLINGVGPATIAHMQKHPAFTDLYQLDAMQIARSYSVSFKTADLIVVGLNDSALLEDELRLIQRHNVSWVTVFDIAYPPLLKEIDSPPAVLYYRGANLHSFTKNIAIIGSRKAAGYAEQVVEACVPSLVQSGWSIVSGGAIGADTMAHKQTLARGGRTVAILGSGLLHPYPHCNKKMFEMIVENGGSVVSSFSLDTNPHPGNFPARNRIIAGMSQACLVVQAAERSGASITANFALNQGKQVLAVPGSMFDPLSAGCHALIKEGATPILSALDLLQELGEAPLALDKSVQMNIADALVPKSSTVENIPKSRDVSVALPENASVEERILFHCREPLSPEDLLAYIELDMQLLQDHLFDLQLAGRLEQNAVGLWQSIS